MNEGALIFWEQMGLFFAVLVFLLPPLMLDLFDKAYYLVTSIYAKWHMKKYRKKSKYWPTGRF